MKIRNLLVAFVCALVFAMTACDFKGGVVQGRCVAFDPDTRMLTMVVDTTLDQMNPHYSGEVDTFRLPDDPRDVGPLPEAGGRLMLELDKNKILYFDQATKKPTEMDVEFVDVEKNIGENHPKLKGKEFPIIDREKQTVTVYSRRLGALVTFKVPESALSLPAYTWKAGDEVRIAFRKDNMKQAIRFMNVSKTSIFKR